MVSGGPPEQHRALLRFEKTREPYCGSTDSMSAGNGSIMRLAPVPLFYARRSREAIERSWENSRTTHGAPVAVDVCRYLGALIVGATHDRPFRARNSNLFSGE